LSLALERLYRLRHLHRGSHPTRGAIDLYRLLVLGLSSRSSAIPLEIGGVAAQYPECFHAEPGRSHKRLDMVKFTPRK
jgi:hypothetical protein